MKQKAALLVVACAFLPAIVMTGRSHVNSAVTTINIHHSATLRADGSAPIPPFPPPPSGLQVTAVPSTIILADGSAPIPPFPPPPSGLEAFASEVVV